MDGPSQSKETIFGFQIQADEGTGEDDAVVWCPYDDTSNWGPKGGMVPLDQADTHHQYNVALLEGKWYEGDIPATFRPSLGFLNLFFGTGGVVNSTSRNVYNVAPCMTVFAVDKVGGTQRVRAAQDCRVATWSLRWTKGLAEYVHFTALLRGKSAFSTSAVPSGSYTDPYRLKEAFVDISTAGGAYGVCVNIEEVEIRGDEHLIDAGDGTRSGTGDGPFRLDNEGSQEVQITFTRDLVDTMLYDVYVAQRDNDSIDGASALALRWRFVAGGVTCTLVAPRCGIREYADEYPGSKIGKKVERVVVDAYMSADGATPAIQASAA